MIYTKPSPDYCKFLSERQIAFLQTAIGIKFYHEFLTKYGKHIFVFGGTGSGKTQKGYWLVDWLKHHETQIWISTGKSNEILPLLFMGKKIRIITPVGSDVVVEERVGRKYQRVTEGIEIVTVGTPGEMLDSIKGGWDTHWNRKPDYINILEIRNAFQHFSNALDWMAELFEKLAYKCRLGDMPSIFPASLHADESQWMMAGKRISGEGDRSRVSEIVTENALELRSTGLRLCLYAQSYKNIPPAARENMNLHIMCRGNGVEPEENQNLAQYCRVNPYMVHPLKYKPNEGRFVFEDGFSRGVYKPWQFPLFPENPKDYERMRGMRVRYVGKHDEQSETEEIQFPESFPFMGVVPAFSMSEEKQEDDEHYSRYHIPEECG